MLTQEQRAALSEDINGSIDQAVVAARGGGDIGRNDTELARLYNLPSDVLVWRSDVTLSEIYHGTSREGTMWDWQTFATMSANEQNAWCQMVADERIDFSIPQLRRGLAVLPESLSTHVIAMAKRSATRAEALFASGDEECKTLNFAGEVTIHDIGRACQEWNRHGK